MRSLARRAAKRFLAVAAALAISGPALQAQLTTGAAHGTVTDQNGALLPGVAITALNTETGVSESTLTDEHGAYRFPALAARSYEIRASLIGFRSQLRNHIALSAGQEAVLNFELVLGNVAAELMDESDTPVTVELSPGSAAGLVDQQELPAVPLNGRNFLELVPLQAGAVLADTGVANAAFGFAEKLSVEGARYSSNLFLLDGADINDASGTAGSTAGSLASLDAIREFRVFTDSYDAELGPHTGGVVSAITKSGTNHLHGSLFNFLRNSALDARNFFDAVPGSAHPVNQAHFERNQFGLTLGGPIRPEKTFFFGSYEGLREKLGSTPTYQVPRLNMRAGMLYGVQYAIDPRVKPFLDAFHLPNQPEQLDFTTGLPTGVADYITSASQDTREDYWMGRVEHRVAAEDTLLGRLVVDDSDRWAPGLYTRERSAAPARLALIEETHAYSPALLGKTHLSFNRTDFESRDLATTHFLFPQFNFTGQSGVPGGILIPGISGIDASNVNPKINIQNAWQFQEDIYHSSARHSIKMGLLFERLQFNMRSDAFTGGEYTFADPESFLQDEPNSALFAMPGSDDIRGWRQNLAGSYLHDTFQAGRKLSLSLGVRYEFISVPSEVNGKVANIRDMGPQHLYSVTTAQTDIGAPYFLNPSLRNAAPRVGLAWSPAASGKTSLRAGFGIFDEQILPVHYSVPGVRTAPFYSVAELFERDLQANGMPLAFPNAFFSERQAVLASGGRPQVNGIEFKPSQPTAMKWSLDVERQLSATTFLTAGYSASRGTHLDRGSQLLNSTPEVQINGQQFLAVDLPLPNSSWNSVQWQTFDGTSFYNALRIELQKHTSGGLQFQASYTYSKATDDSSTAAGGDWTNDPAGYRSQKWHGLSAFDVRHSFYATAVYSVPGTRLAPGGLLAGWTTSSLVRMNSGPPETLSATRPMSNPAPGVLNSVQFVGASSLDLIMGGDANPIHAGDPIHYYDTSQFRWPASFYTDASLARVPGLGNLITLGNLGRGTLIAPGIVSWDLTLMKNTPLRSLGESAQVQFRAECFNLLNRANFGFADGNVFNSHGRLDPSAGRIESTRGSSRQIQVALKLLF